MRKIKVCGNVTHSNQVHPKTNNNEHVFRKTARLQFSRHAAVALVLLTVVMDWFLLTALTATLQQGFFPRCPETWSTLT